MVALALAAAGCGGSGGTSQSQTLGYLGSLTTSRSLSGRPCGHGKAGRQWTVKASSSITCGSARRLVQTFYARKCQVDSASRPNASSTIARYTCVEAPPAFKGGFIWCFAGKRSVVAS